MMNTERLHRLADFIEKLPHVPTSSTPDGTFRIVESGFSMTDFHYECGSPACIAGWAAEMWAKEDFNTPIAAMRELDLTEEQATELFSPDNPDASVTACRGDAGFISPRRAAHQLRHVAATGKVDWSIHPLTSDG